MTDEMVTMLYQLKPVTWEVEIMQAEENPALYKVVAPYGKAFADALLAQDNISLTPEQYDANGERSLTLDATDPEDVYFPKTYIGCDWGSGEMYIGIPTTSNVYFRDGIFSAPPRGIAVGDDDGAFAANYNGKFRIVLPGVEATDYTLTITPASNCYDTPSVSNTITYGADVTSIKYAIAENVQEDEMMSFVKEVAEYGIDYSMDTEFSYEMAEVRKETLIMVGFNYKGEQVAFSWTSYYYIPEDADNWEPIGKAQYTDDVPGVLISNMTPVTYEVDIEEHKSRPGYYRLVNAYDEKYPYNTNPDRYHTDHNHYIYVNAEDPEFVYIEESIMGCDWGYGAMRISSYPEYFLAAGFDIEEVKELEMNGILEDRVITMPEGSVLFSMLGYDNGDWYESNESGEYRIELPESTGIKAVEVADEEAPVEYFNLQGIRVANPSNGVFIKVKGSKSEKIAL